ncbi:putrescine/spermidine ABC transporter, partial [Acinetobacter pittii]|nr:putrescine/spermidine ABC transporter [Acinetobacter pittii]HAV4722842.1 putrescine/spermidine ABC transporter [Acinetobacter baumannii]
SVISRYALRDGKNKSIKDIINYIIVPTLGFASVFLMWLEIDKLALQIGLAWAVFGVGYLAYKTKGFKYNAPQHNEHE